MAALCKHLLFPTPQPHSFLCLCLHPIDRPPFTPCPLHQQWIGIDFARFSISFAHSNQSTPLRQLYPNLISAACLLCGFLGGSGVKSDWISFFSIFYIHFYRNCRFVTKSIFNILQLVAPSPTHFGTWIRWSSIWFCCPGAAWYDEPRRCEIDARAVNFSLILSHTSLEREWKSNSPSPSKLRGIPSVFWFMLNFDLLYLNGPVQPAEPKKCHKEMYNIVLQNKITTSHQEAVAIEVLLLVRLSIFMSYDIWRAFGGYRLDFNATNNSWAHTFLGGKLLN